MDIRRQIVSFHINQLTVTQNPICDRESYSRTEKNSFKFDSSVGACAWQITNSEWKEGEKSSDYRIIIPYATVFAVLN